jgi:hypothetical protein
MPKKSLYCTVRAEQSKSFIETRYSGLIDFEGKLCIIINQQSNCPDEFNLQIKMDDATYFVMANDFDLLE